MTHRDIIKLNLGCGPSGINGWLNYDWGALPILSKIPLVRKLVIKLGFVPSSYDVVWPKIKLVDISRKLPLDNNCVNYIYCSHVLEHFEKYQTEFILSECYRVLKNGGVMRIVLPDLSKLIMQFTNAIDFNRKFFGFDKDKKSLSNFFVRGHQWMYDEISIVTLLKKYFSKIEVVGWRKGKCPDINILDLESHSDHSLYVEIKK